ncbi:MAG: hypothetical protein HQ546_07185, partial [Planctomycetes bacterium]|nr:hypothetical protein [Planctomycetota bacterium]
AQPVASPPQMEEAKEEQAQWAVRISAMEGIPAILFQVPVGTKKTVIFYNPIGKAQIKRAWLEMLVNDIDEPKEATITLNGRTPIKIEGSVMGEAEGHFGRLAVPVAALVEGKNTFEFTFADNLADSTEGYIITDASLALQIQTD